MDTFADLDALDRSLSRAADRHVPPPLEPRRLRRRRAMLAVGPLLWLLFVLALAVAAACDRPWWFAAGLAVVLVPGAVADLVGRRREVAALTDAGDLAAYERGYFAAQAKRQRSAVVIEGALAVLFAIVAWWSGEPWRWVVPAGFGALAVGRAVTVLPYVERCNRDAGGERAHGWAVELLVLGIVLLLPLLLVGRGVRRLWRALAARRGGVR